MSEESEVGGEAKSRGIFFTKGTTIKLKFVDGFVLRIKDDGEVEGGRTELHLALNVSPYWLEIAYRHLLDAEAAHNDLIAAHQEEDEQRLGRALEAGFLSGMQALVASAVALDAIYAATKQHVTIPRATAKAWRRNKLSRPKRIVEILRRGYKISNRGVKSIKSTMQQLFRLRNKAVHPTAEATRATFYAEIERGTEWRLVAFRYENVKTAVGFALSLIAQLSERPREKYPDLVKYAESLRKKVLPLVDRWEAKYGKLIPNSGQDDPEREEGEA